MTPPGHEEPAAPGPLPAGQDRSALLAEVRRALARVPAGARVVLAVSGGPDSTACAFLATEARPDLEPVLGHVRHGLRDDRADLAAVRAQAAFLGAPLEVREVTVERAGAGLEAAARAQRYAALRRVAREVEAGWLLVGHTADDQAETLLLRLARGTGVPGLGGMAPVRGDLVRPLLRVRRADVHTFVRLEGLPVALDPSNADRAFARNAVRLDVLPLLERLAPDPVAALGRLADLARDDARSLDERAAEVLRSAERRVGPVVAVPLDLLAGTDVAVARRVARALLLQARGGGDPPTAEEVETLRLLAEGAVDLPGASATAAAGWLAVCPADLPVPAPRPLVVPGPTPWPALGWRLRSGTADSAAGGDQLQLGLLTTWVPRRIRVDEALLPPGAVPERAEVLLGGLGTPLPELEVRSRRPGDRVAAAGGTRKLQDVFVDAGVPRSLRDLLPIVSLGERVLWVPGLVVDAAAHRAGQSDPQLQLWVARR